MFVCWSVKGGSGTTVVAAALALVLARSRPTLLVDLAGDVPAALGLAETQGPGVTDWLSSGVADTAALDRLMVAARHQLSVVPRGGGAVSADTDHPERRWRELRDVLAASGRTAVIDAGLGTPPPALGSAGSLLVIRSCFLALRRAASAVSRPSGVVLVTEPGRALGRDDVERSLGSPVVAQIPWDPAVARAVDAGLLRPRLPRSISHPLVAVTNSPLAAPRRSSSASTLE